MWKGEVWEATVGLEAHDLVLHHPSPLLHPYRSFQGTLGARRFGVPDKIRGMSLSYGSASDRPFARPANDTASANYLHQFNHRWWGLVNWSNNRAFLNNVPIPGVFYVQKATKEKTLMYGLPVLVWRKRWESGLEGGYFGFIPFNHRAHVGWFWEDKQGLTLNYEYRPQAYFRENRLADRERLFFVENRLTLQWQRQVKAAQLELGVGRAFARSVFEAKNLRDDKRFDVPLGDAWLVQGQFGLAF